MEAGAQAAVIASTSIRFHEYRPGNEDFRHYIQRLDYCFIANNIVDDTAKKANFFTVCGPQVYELAVALITPLNTFEVTYDTIVRLLLNHFTPRANEITMTYRFYHRTQQDGEKATEYNTELRKIAAFCNFDNLERQLRDRLVCGMRCEKLKFDLLKRNSLTYQEVIDEMIAAEMAQQDVSFIQTNTTSTSSSSSLIPSTSVEPMDIGALKEKNGTPTYKYRMCYRCGSKHGGICRYINTVCNFCQKKGHIEKICTQKQRKPINRVNYTSDGNNSNEFLNGIYSFRDQPCQLEKVSPIEIEILLSGVKVNMQVDSGASYSLINTETFQQLPKQQRQDLKPLTLHLSTWTNTPVKLLGQLRVEVEYKECRTWLTVIVAKGRGPNLLGRDWFQPLNISINNINEIKEEEECRDLLLKYKNIFMPGLGKYNGEPVHIQVSPKAVPIFLKARPIPYALRERVENEIDNMVQEGVLRPIPYSQWATPVVPIIKKNGNIRLCGDYRSTVNQATEADTYPMPTANEIFAILAGGKFFTTLDLDRAYTQVTVDDETAKLLTLNTCKGLFSVHRLAFGVKASPGIFQRIMTSLLANITGVAVLLDDIIITGSSYQEMHDRLSLVLNRIEQAGLRLNKDKCRFARDRVEFLGFVIDAEGIHPAPSKVEAITNTPAPKNVKELQAFLGLYNFYERFVPHKATILEPLHRLLDKKGAWKWSEKEQTAFLKAKNQITSNITLTHYDIHKKLILTCDSSEYGIGVVLAHIMDDGKEKPIAMGSRTLHSHERKYSQLDKEATAILFGIKKFNNYLMGRKFTIITDHQPLLGIFNPSKKIPDLLSPRLVRYCLALAAHDYNIIYRPGKAIGNADGLSRWPLPVKSDDAVVPGEILLIAETPQDLPYEPEDMAKETAKDPVLRQVMQYILKGWPARVQDKDIHAYWLHRMEMSLQDGCILLGNRVVMPPNMRTTVLKLLHQTHSGIVHTKALARSYVWWPGMDKSIETLLNSCKNCAENQNMPAKSSHEWIVPCRPWSRIHIDFAGPFQNKMFLIVVDAFYKWPEIQLVNNMTTATVIKCLRNLFAQHGLCETLISDNGTPFTSKEFEDFLKANKVRHIKSAPYHPATNGQVERMVGTLKNKLRKMTDIPWEIKLPRILLGLRTTPSSATNKSPAELLMKRKLRTLLDTIHPDINKNRQVEHQIQRNTMKKHREAEVGTRVMYRNFSEGPRWMSGRIVDKRGPSSYNIETEAGNTVHRHIDQLVKVREPEQDGKSDGEVIDREDETIEMEKTTEGEFSPIEEEVIQIPSAEQWAEMLGIPEPAQSGIGKVRKKPYHQARLPYSRP